jgi:hypothetical protein
MLQVGATGKRESERYRIFHVLYFFLSADRTILVNAFLSNVSEADSEFLARLQLSLAYRNTGLIAVLYNLIFV